MSPPIYAGGRLGFFVKSKPFGDKEWGNRDPKTKVEEKSKKVNTGWGPRQTNTGTEGVSPPTPPLSPQQGGDSGSGGWSLHRNLLISEKGAAQVPALGRTLSILQGL